MKKLTVLVFLIILVLDTSCQEVRNQFNTQGEKQGHWDIYLSKNLKIIKDSTKARYKIIEYFENGKFNHHPIRITNNHKIICSKKNLSNKSSTYMDGTYTIYNKKDELVMTLHYKNGKKIGLHKFYDNKGLYLEIDYDKNCNNEKYSFVVRTFNSKTGKIKFERCIIIKNNIWIEEILK